MHYLGGFTHPLQGLDEPRTLGVKLAAVERPKWLYDYFVTGQGEFPLDMLSHDACWPVSVEDAAKIMRPSSYPQDQEPRTIRVRSNNSPTFERWASFGWKVSGHRRA